MDFLKISVDTTPEGTEILPARLLSLGVEGVEIDEEGEFLRFIEEKTPHWDFVDESLYGEKSGLARVTFYLTADENGQSTLKEVRESLKSLPAEVPEMDFGCLEVSVGTVSSEDWEDAWKPFYKPVEIGRRLLILPAWEERPKTDRVVYLNDPGQAFGTGTHATTKLMLEYVEEHVRSGDTVLDIGCGSGILSIAAILLGASSADAVDIDPGACAAAALNAERNSVPACRYHTSCKNILQENIENEGKKRHNLVFMNIVADVILPLLPRVRDLVAEDGRLFISGILSERRAEVERALSEAGLIFVSAREEDGWAALEIRPLEM